MALIAPSILSANFANLERDFDLLNQSACDYIHIDVMDGHYVNNLTFGPPVISHLRPLTKKPFDVHLMIDRPERSLKSYKEAGADFLTVHRDATIHLHRTIQEIKEMGLKAGVALNPAQSPEEIRYILRDLDLVLLMSVNPGFGGQSFVPQVLDKIKELKDIRTQGNYSFKIEVDGGVKLDNAKEVLNAGADILVAGSAVFNAPDPLKRIQEFKDIQ